MTSLCNSDHQRANAERCVLRGLVQNPGVYWPQSCVLTDDDFHTYRKLFEFIRILICSWLKDGKYPEFSEPLLLNIAEETRLTLTPDEIGTLFEAFAPERFKTGYDVLRTEPLTFEETRHVHEQTSLLIRAETPPLADHGDTGRLILECAADVEPEELVWLWQDRFLTGHINVIAGDPGLGKSLVLVDVAARVSSGRQWPDGSPCKQGSVLYSTTEDGFADVVTPRLIAAGAEMSRIHYIKGVRCSEDCEIPIFLDEHIHDLERCLASNPDISLLIIDTLQSHVGPSINTNNNASSRRVMTPLKRLAEKYRVAVCCIEHLTKSKTTSAENATYRIQGSIAFAGAARSVWIVCKDQEDPDGKRRYLQASKTNLAPDGVGLGLSFQIDGPTGRPFVRWIETDVSIPISQMLTIPEPGQHDSGQENSSKLEQVCDWLTNYLTEPVPQKQIENGCKAEMFSNATVRRAKEKLGIKSARHPDGQWYWHPSADMLRESTERQLEILEA